MTQKFWGRRYSSVIADIDKALGFSSFHTRTPKKDGQGPSCPLLVKLPSCWPVMMQAMHMQGFLFLSCRVIPVIAHRLQDSANDLGVEANFATSYLGPELAGTDTSQLGGSFWLRNSMYCTDQKNASFLFLLQITGSDFIPTLDL